MEIASCVHSCLSKFKGLEDNSHVDVPSIEDEHGRFRVWTGNISAHSTGRRSLEYRLRDSSNLQRTVTTLLKDLEAILEQLQELAEAVRTGKELHGSLSFVDEAAQADVPDDDGDDADLFGLGGEEASARALFEQALEEAHDVITCLLRFSMTLRNPARHDQLKQAAATSAKHFEPHDVNHVREKYPNAADFLHRRLGKAISKHRQYFKYREEHHVKLAEGLSDKRVIDDERPSTIATSLVNSAKVTVQAAPIELAEETESVYTATSFAPTTSGDATLRPPPLPEKGRNGDPFECPLCYGIVVAEDQRSWRQHVYEDLPPYICTSEFCSSGEHRYSRRRDWQRHQAKFHDRHWLCPFGCDDKIHLESDFHTHLAGQHSESLGSESVQRIADVCAVSDGIGDLTCPLCKELMPTSKRWFKHLGHHLEQCALHALPKHQLNPTSDDEAEIVGISDEEELTESEDTNLLGDGTDYKPPAEDVAGSAQPSAAPFFDKDGNVIDEEGQIELSADETMAFLSTEQQSGNQDYADRSGHPDDDIEHRRLGEFAGNYFESLEPDSIVASRNECLKAAEWSVSEQQELRELVRQFGFDFKTIARHMGAEAATIKEQVMRQESLGDPLGLQLLGREAWERGTSSEDNQPPRQPPLAIGHPPERADALSYVDLVRRHCKDKPEVYDRFLDILREFQDGQTDTELSIRRVRTLFAGETELIDGFTVFVPKEFTGEVSQEDSDALSYLDRVKQRFADRPDVYDRFLDILQDLKKGEADTSQSIARVRTLFAGEIDLVEAFEKFTPSVPKESTDEWRREKRPDPGFGEDSQVFPSESGTLGSQSRSSPAAADGVRSDTSKPTLIPMPDPEGTLSDLQLSEPSRIVKDDRDEDQTSDDKDAGDGEKKTRRSKTKDKMWTEITKDLVMKEAIEEQGYEYEETDDFYYIMTYLRYEDVLSLVETTEDIRRQRRDRIRGIHWERDELERRAPPKALPELPSIPEAQGGYNERVFERKYYP